MNIKDINAMRIWIDKYDKALDDKEMLSKIYDENWRNNIRSKLLKHGNLCYLGNAFGYQAPLLEYCGLIQKGWQYRLEEGAQILLPKLSQRDRGHLIKRMRDTESVSAEEELLLARGFAQEFGDRTINIPKHTSTKPEFEVTVGKHCILVEAKSRFVAQAVEQERELRRHVKEQLGIEILDPPLFDEDIDQWIKQKISTTLKSKSKSGCGFVLVLSLYTTYTDFNVADLVREHAMRQDKLGLLEEQWALAIALVSSGAIQGIWFNLSVCTQLNVEDNLRERIRAAIRDSFYPWPSGIFFHEKMTDEEHRSMMDKLLGVESSE